MRRSCAWRNSQERVGGQEATQLLLKKSLRELRRAVRLTRAGELAGGHDPNQYPSGARVFTSPVCPVSIRSALRGAVCPCGRTGDARGGGRKETLRYSGGGGAHDVKGIFRASRRAVALFRRR